MVCRPTKDAPLSMKTWMTSVVSRHEPWLPSVVLQLWEWRLPKLGCQWKNSAHGDVTGKSSSARFRLPRANLNSPMCGLHMFRISKHCFILHFPILQATFWLKVASPEWNEASRLLGGHSICQYRCSGNSSLWIQCFQLTTLLTECSLGLEQFYFHSSLEG